MPRTPINDDLVHTHAAARDADPLADVRAALEPAALAWARDSLAREAAELAAGAWIDEARSALGAVLRDPSALDALDAGAAREGLAAEIGAEVPAPDEQDALDHAAATARALAAAWCELLAGRVESGGGRLALDDALLPKGDDAGAFGLALEASLDAFGLRGDALRGVLRDGARSLFASGVREVELPLGVVLVRDARGAIEARSAEGAGAAEMAHSGERRRDGAADEAEAGRATPRRR